MVERDADHVGAQLVQLGEGAAVGLLLDDDGVALGHEQAVDQVEALHRARGDQDLVRRALDAGMVLELGREELAQRLVAQRPAVQAVGRERRALALQDRRRRVDQRLDGHVLGVVVAADEVVFREPVPLGGGSGRAGRQQGREIERSGHGRFLFGWPIAGPTKGDSQQICSDQAVARNELACAMSQALRQRGLLVPDTSSPSSSAGKRSAKVLTSLDETRREM